MCTNTWEMNAFPGYFYVKIPTRCEELPLLTENKSLYLNAFTFYNEDKMVMGGDGSPVISSIKFDVKNMAYQKEWISDVKTT
ncbi:hypothetical protein GCM10011409_37560 [Lentibacillus populi]|uniref:Uncharacterized protein n=1 Tax=Lentibacillus populi TaxID=1827502 RepID=A0A9W5U0Q5_9BACI|nr:hypothetical protein GCM10011409_37560 [Lentibacillus populi]